MKYKGADSMKKITVCDFTLKALTAEDPTGLLFREKTAIAACIDNIGADKLELPPVRREKEDAIICKTIASLIKNCELALPAGTDEKSIACAWECIKTAKKPCLQVALPVSTAQMEYSFRMKEPAMLENIAKLVSLAKEKCDNVEFIALDATRADEAFLIKACLAAKENGAVCVTLCDDAGLSLPDDIAQLVKTVKDKCGLPVFVCLSDNISMATAGAAAAIEAGADGVKTAMAGKNVLLTEKFAAMMNAAGAKLCAGTSLISTELNRDIHSVIKGIRHSSPAASAPAGEADIFLDSQSTLAEVSEAVKILGYDLTDEDNGKVHKALMQICERKNSVSAKELEALIAANAMQAPSAYHLVSFSATCSSNGSSMAQVTLDKNGEALGGVALGDGPIDSAFRAIEQCIGYHYELDAFEIQAVTEGKEALGSTLVRLRNNGKLYAGTGLSTDIVGAGVRAYINALNKIAAEEN